MLAGALGGVIVNMAQLPRGYWLTLAVFTTLQMDLERSLVRALQASLGILAAAAILIYIGHGLADPPLMVMILLPLVVLGRAFQANHYGLFVLQTTLLFLLLAETLAQDWNLPQIRLINASLGVGVALLIATLMHLLHLLLARRSRRKAQLAAAQRTDEQTTSRSDQVFRIPHIHQRADVVLSKLAAAFQPGIDLGALLFGDRTTARQADETVVFTADITKLVGFHRLADECFEEVIHGLAFDTFAIGEIDLEAQLLELIDTEFLAQATRTIGSHWIDPFST